MQCPKCSLESPSSALRCDCGHLFSHLQGEQTNIEAELHKIQNAQLFEQYLQEQHQINDRHIQRLQNQSLIRGCVAGPVMFVLFNGLFFLLLTLGGPKHHSDWTASTAYVWCAIWLMMLYIAIRLLAKYLDSNGKYKWLFEGD